MSALPFSPFQIPLPPGWTEHIGPNGQPYYYNTLTRESSYIRPVPILAAQAEPVKKKKEKPILKTPIPGTDWLRVTTTEGNTFYSHKIRKESVWVVPDELKTALEDFQSRERTREQEALNASTRNSIKLVNAKRKAEQAVPVDEIVVSKKPKVEDENEESESEEEEGEEEDWQRDAAEQLAAEAEEERKRVEEEMRREVELEAQQRRTATEIFMPQKVDLSVEEGKALFKTLLREKDVNPLHPWDTSLPKFVSDPRYVLLPSVAARRDAFDEYCKERARELRQSAVKKEKDVVNPKDEYERLLRDEVKSTRTSWTDFRRTWKKDRRFYGWGRDDREREKRFRDFLKELGEQKKQAALRAEADFFALLNETPGMDEASSWKEVKKYLYKDLRYGAVGSSSSREELFNTFLKGKGSNSRKHDQTTNESTAEDELSSDNATNRQDKQLRAVQEREEMIRIERRKVDADIQKSKIGINKEEGERLFRTLLTDAIRDPQITWDHALIQLKTDPRFTSSPLLPNHQVHLFHNHVGQLRVKQINNLHNLFDANAPSLATSFGTLPLESILSSLPVNKLGYDAEQVENEFKKWQRERSNAARIAFDEMLSENSFVEFWGRLGKLGGEGIKDGLQMDDDDIGEGGDEKVDMKTLAKSVDVREMEKVLKNDKRYIMFDHIPDQRERWLRDYLSQLAAPKLSVHVNN